MPSSYTAQRVITAARDRHPAFDEQAHPDQVCLRWLSTFQQTLAQHLAHLDDQVLVTQLVVPFPLANFVNGITLPPHQYLDAPKARLRNQPDLFDEVTLIPFAHRQDRSYPFPSAHLVGGDVLLLSGIEADWSPYDQLWVRYSPSLTPLVALTDTFNLPDTAEPTLVAALAHFLGQRAAAFGEPVNASVLQMELTSAEQALFDQIAMRRRAETDLVREVW